ncbi:hypothetical protein StoSoilB13_27040 (plasmid) [Arthrobacter sp. StoSoilB13]|nr:hypothetical protein StoSoilB13_27040 [Arthrobacter sp. StoSoilB13]
MSGRPGNRIQFDSDASVGTVTVLFEVGDGTGVHFAGGLIDVEPSQVPRPTASAASWASFSALAAQSDSAPLR